MQSVYICIRFVISKKYTLSIEAKNTKNTKKITFLFFIAIVYSSLTWSFGFILGVIYAPPSYEFLSLLMFAGLVSSAMLSILPIFNAFIIYFITLLIPQIMILLYFNTQIHIGALSSLLVYSPLFFILASSIYKNLLDSFANTEKLIEKNAQLHELSITDPLTKIYNRRHFLESSDSHFSSTKPRKTDTSLLVLDVDHFKQINDKYGHQAGDFILVEMVKLIKKQLRKSDVMARIGGEEFAILLPNMSLTEAKKIAERICQIIREKEFIFKEMTIKTTMSIGIGFLNEHHKTFDDFFCDADANLYKAKSGGRDLVFFS